MYICTILDMLSTKIQIHESYAGETNFESLDRRVSLHSRLS